MRVMLTGPLQGSLSDFYRTAKVESPDWIVCSGDFGIFPDPARMDRASKRHSARDFSLMYVGATPSVEIPTLTIAGVHDDNKWLNYRQASNNMEILPNVSWLAQGYKTVIGTNDTVLRVSGLGRAFSSKTYNGEPAKKSHRHYTKRDVERACSSGPTDLLVIYDHLDRPGISNIIFATRPKLILTVAHPGAKVLKSVQNIPVVALKRNEARLITWIDNNFN